MAKKTSTESESTAEPRIYQSLQQHDPSQLSIDVIMHDCDRVLAVLKGAIGEAEQIFNVLRTRASQIAA
jgi:hypothetical protein